MSNTNIDRNYVRGSTQSNVTFGTGNISHHQSQQFRYPAGQSPAFIDYDRDSSLPYFGPQGVPAQFEIADGSQVLGLKVRVLLDKLDEGCYVFYKYFVLIMAIIDAIEALISLVGWFDAESSTEFFASIFITAFTVWSSFQLALEYQAIKLKEYKYAQQAVILMQWYMIVLALTMAAENNKLSTIVRELGVNMSASEYTLIVMVFIIISEVFFYFLYLFGAIKVRNILMQVNELLGSTGTPGHYRQMPEPV